MSRRQFLALILPLLAVITGFIVLWGLERSGVPGAPRWDSDMARYVRDRMGQEYVSGLGDRRHQWAAYFAALDTYVKFYDGYAAVIPPWDVEAEKEASSGRYTGIGVRIGDPSVEVAEEGAKAEEAKEEAKEPGPVESVLVTGVKPQGPAAKAGVLVGDRIIAVDGKPVPEILPHGLVPARGEETPLQKAIRGLEGTPVVLRLRAPGGAERDVTVVRAQVDDGSVFGARFLDHAGGIGYVRIAEFEASTAKDLRAALEGLAKGGLKALVLDIRGNPGGLLDQAVGVANLFLADGVIVKQRGRLSQFTATYSADPKEVWNATIPLALLVSGRSASASEVLAGALHDRGRAVIVGERTWGKFLVQLVEEVPTDAGTAIFKRTTSIYETPLGHSYQRTAGEPEDPLAGIPPDVFVPMGEKDKEELLHVFQDEIYADWDPAHKPSVNGFRDVQIDAATSLLAGKSVYPALLP